MTQGERLPLAACAALTALVAAGAAHGEGDAARGAAAFRACAACRKIWEFNLRFKTDATDSGPSAGKPVLLVWCLN